MEVERLPLFGLKLIKPNVYTDERGFFLETYNDARYWDKEIYSDPFVQDNHSRSIKNVVRGLHYQANQAKLIRCTNGIVYDVVVDIRKDSPTFGQHYGIYLYSSDCWQLYIPSGMAHAFITLSDTADFEYKVTNYYDPKTQGSIVWNDIDLNIQWPGIENYILSDKDKLAQSFQEYKDKL